MKIREVRMFKGKESVMDVCKKYEMYTCGTCEEYSKLLEFCESSGYATKESLYIVARDIFEFSDIQKISETLNSNGRYTENDYIAHIMAILAANATVTFFEITE